MDTKTIPGADAGAMRSPRARMGLPKRQNIRLDEEMLYQVKKLALEEERSVSQMLRLLVREGLRQRRD